MLFGLVCQNVLADCGIFWTIASFVKISSGHSDFFRERNREGSESLDRYSISIHHFRIESF
jgi:hypothetical protein